jgi:hypothetical protein
VEHNSKVLSPQMFFTMDQPGRWLPDEQQSGQAVRVTARRRRRARSPAAAAGIPQA